MTTWFITRHSGARDWAQEADISIDRVVDHLEVEQLQPGDLVLGTLPVHLAARVCQCGARYLHLRLDLERRQRGVDLSAEEMRRAGARLEEYRVEQVN